jgi:hypothetical protein
MILVHRKIPEICDYLASVCCITRSLMSTLPPTISTEDEIQAPQRPPSPPFHVTFAARGLHVRPVLQATGTCPTPFPYRHKTSPHINRVTFEYLLHKR